MTRSPSMKNWFIENSLGICPTFKEVMGDEKHKVTKQHIPSQECGRAIMVWLSPLVEIAIDNCKLLIRGFQKREFPIRDLVINQELYVKDNKLVFSDPIETKFTSFSCFDETVFYFFMVYTNQIKIYKTHFCLCNVLRSAKVFLYEVNLFENKQMVSLTAEPTFELVLKCFNSKSLHYNWNPREPEKYPTQGLKIRFGGEIFSTEENLCIFCFKYYKCKSMLMKHYKIIHINYDIYEYPHLLDFVERNIEIKSQTTEFLYKRRNRTCSPDKLYTFPYDYYESETMETLGTRKLEKDWRAYLDLKKIDEIIDIKKEQHIIIKKWYIFMRNREETANYSNIVKSLTEFVLMNEATFDMLSFLSCFYNDAIISIEELKNIILKKVARRK